jgi:hypothetical protein
MGYFAVRKLVSGIMIVGGLTSLSQQCAIAGTENRTSKVAFSDCIATIGKLSQELGVAPINIVETSNLRLVKYPTRDGSVMIQCVGTEGTMTVTTVKN